MDFSSTEKGTFGFIYICRNRFKFFLVTFIMCHFLVFFTFSGRVSEVMSGMINKKKHDFLEHQKIKQKIIYEKVSQYVL